MWAIVVPLVVSSLIVIPDIEKNLIIDNNITNFIRYYCSIYLIYKEVISDYYIYRGFIPLHMIIKWFMMIYDDLWLGIISLINVFLSSIVRHPKYLLISVLGLLSLFRIKEYR